MVDTTDKSVPEYSAKWWIDTVHEQEKVLEEGFWKFGDRIVERYLDQRSDNGDHGTRKYNIFWANVQIMKSALYATPPKPMVTRQNGDSKDDVARTAALMLQRILDIGINKDASDMHAAFKNGVDDRLIPGLGQVWLRYDCETEKVPASVDPLTQVVIPEREKITREEAPCDYVHWRDFIWSPSRTWEENWWVCKRVWMKKKRFIKRFSQEIYSAVKGSYDNAKSKENEGVLPKGFSKGRVEVLEIWCEDTNKVYWVNRYYDKACLDEKDDPLQLDGFFPCPKPLLATHTTNDVTPRADFTMVQDQYDELDTLNDRISILTKALRVVGVYDKTSTELKQMLSGSEFQMIPVENWAMFAEKQGLKGQVDWFPIDVIAEVLGKLMEQRISLVGQIYELTSISDIMRGASNAQETAKAQTLKAQYSSVRLQLTQQSVAQWVAASMQIKAEIACRHFQASTLIEQSQIMMTESAKYAEQAVALLKNYRATEYRIEIGDEQLSIADYNAEREMRTQYLTAVGQFLSQASSIMAEAPNALPYLLRMVQWVTASFRGSSDIETVLDEAVAAANTAAQNPQGKDDGKAAAMAAVEQLKLQMETIKGQQKLASDQSAERIAQAEITSDEKMAQWKNATDILLQQMEDRVTTLKESAIQERETHRTEMDAMLERMKIAQQAVSDLVAHAQARAAQESDHEHELEVQANEPAPAAGE